MEREIAQSKEAFAELKEAVRNEVLVRRNAIPLKDRMIKSERICDKLYRHLEDAFQQQAAEAAAEECDMVELLSGKNIAVFSSMKSEVTLDPFVRKMYQYEAKVCFPCMTKNLEYDDRAPYSPRNYMVFRAVSAAHYTSHMGGNSDAIAFMGNPLKSFFLNDETLADFPAIPDTEIDIVIVPLVAFNKKFHRLGYGGGNYDRFLANVRDDALVVGVAFAEQEVAVVPLEAHDLPLPHIIFA